MTYLDRALSDLKAAEICLKPAYNPSNDEGLLDICGYHIQQAVEKTLKYILHDMNGVDDTTRRFRTHDIVSLIVMVESETAVVIPDAIKQIAVLLTQWEVTTRYPSGISTVRSELVETIAIAKPFVLSYYAKTE